MIQGKGSSAYTIIAGEAKGQLLFSDVPLSFMMGVDPDTGRVIDAHHPLHGQSVKDCILAIPCGRGSCAASGILLETLCNNVGPAALVFQMQEPILTLGVLMAEALFGRSIPVIVIPNQTIFLSLLSVDEMAISRDSIWLQPKNVHMPLNPIFNNLSLTTEDQILLAGDRGDAAKVAMEVLISFAKMQGAPCLISVSQAHIDACVYMGKSSLLFAQKLLALGGKVAVPSTMNAISVDRRRWRDLGMDQAFSENASNLADAYTAMGAKESFTCAPYLLETAPGEGDQIGWAESNAVVFANSVLGARTQKYPDYLDVCIALTGRAPYYGCHTPEGRRPQVAIMIPHLCDPDDSVYPMLGYYIGYLSGPSIPLVRGMKHLQPTRSDLKAFGAGFATTSSASMFHITGITPESSCQLEDLVEDHPIPRVTVTTDDLAQCHKELSTAGDSTVDLVSLGNPHFSFEKFARLARLLHLRTKYLETELVITTSRAVYAAAAIAQYTDEVERFGGQIISDTCWCMLQEPVVPLHARNLMTNSAKYAHYGPGMVRR